MYVEAEYVRDSNERTNSYLYAWSELGFRPLEWLRIGLAGQRTNAYGGDRDLQRGPFAQLTWGRVTIGGYWFNPGSKNRSSSARSAPRSDRWTRIRSTPRFFTHRRHLSDDEIDRAVNVDFVSEVALVVTTEGIGGETIIVLGRYIATGGVAIERSAELAFVVEEDYQGRGIASRLLAHLADLASGQDFT